MTVVKYEANASEQSPTANSHQFDSSSWRMIRDFSVSMQSTAFPSEKFLIFPLEVYRLLKRRIILTLQSSPCPELIQSVAAFRPFPL